MKDKINELETSTKTKYITDLCRDIYEFNEAYQSKTDLV
jgi:hypothetical protein